jgi:hypothetical protein
MNTATALCIAASRMNEFTAIEFDAALAPASKVRAR